jgi:threonine/homoserine/homoserine lactone efflux protein
MADYGAFHAAILRILVPPGPGASALFASTSQGALGAGAAASAGVIERNTVPMGMAVSGVAHLCAAHPAWCKSVHCVACLGRVGLRLLLASGLQRAFASSHSACVRRAPEG